MLSPAKLFQLRKSPNAQAYTSFTACPSTIPYLHPHSRFPCSTTKSISGMVRITVTAAVWLSSARHMAGISTQSSAAAFSTCSPFSSSAPQPDTVTPSPA